MRAGGPGPAAGRGGGGGGGGGGQGGRRGGSAAPHRLRGGAHGQPQHSDTLARGPGARAPTGTRAEGGVPSAGSRPPGAGGAQRDPLPFLEPAAAL